MKSIVRNRFYRYLFPMMLTAFALSFAEIMDGIVVSNLLSGEALAVLNMGNSFDTVLSAVYSMFGIGGSICYAKYQGKSESERAGQFYSNALAGAVLIGLAITVFSILFPETVSNLYCKSDELRPAFDAYLRIQYLFAPFFCGIMTAVSFLPAAGHPIASTVFNIAFNGLNILLDIVFISQFNMGVAGAALATVTSLAVTTVVLYVVLKVRKTKLSFSGIGSLDKSDESEIVLLGTSIAVSQLGFAIRITFCCGLADAAFGTEGLVIFSVCMQLINIMSIFLSGTLRTMTPLVSMLYGQSDYLGVRDTLKRGMKYLATVSVAVSAIIIVFPQIILRLYNVDPASLGDWECTAVRIFALSLAIRCLYILYMSYLNALGRKKYSIYISLFDGFVGLMLFARPLMKIAGRMGFWWSFPFVSVFIIASIVVINMIIVRKSDETIHPICLIPIVNGKGVYIRFSAKMPYFFDAGDKAREIVSQAGCSESFGEKIGQILEEYALYVAKNTKNAALMDAFINCDGNEVQIFLRSTGAFSGAIDEGTAKESDLLVLLDTLHAGEIRYAYAMGVNTVKITIGKEY